MLRLQHVIVQPISIVVGWPVQIGRTQLENGPRPLEHRAEPARSEPKITTDERTIGSKTEVIELCSMI